MKAAIKTAFGQEMSLARDAYKRDQLDEAFRLLERAHILGQRYFTTHFITHWWMLKVGWQRRDAREVRGQLLRLPAALLLSRLWVPLGNTGGANVSPVQPMPIADDLRELMETD